MLPWLAPKVILSSKDLFYAAVRKLCLTESFVVLGAGLFDREIIEPRLDPYKSPCFSPETANCASEVYYPLAIGIPGTRHRF